MKPLLSLLCLLVFTLSARADLLVAPAAVDTAIYENAPTNNGGGDSRLSMGLNSVSSPRRGLFQFDLSSIPAGALVTSVSLRLSVDFAKSPSGSTFETHRLAASWGEGNKIGGKGSAAGAGEATWNSRQNGTAAWTTPGGDFLSTISASAVVSTAADYTWSGAGMVADVQAWVGAPSSNFGWLLLSSASGSAKRFGSSENPTAALRPQLTVNYSVVPEPATPALLLFGLAFLRPLLRKR